MDEKTLVSRILAGETDDFAEIVRRYQVSVFNYAAMKLPYGAEEIAQDVFVRAFARLSQYDLERPFWPWLRGIARNIILEELRKRARQTARRSAYAEHILVQAALEKDDPPEYGYETRLEMLEACVEQLSEKSRRLVQWCHKDRLTSDKIAEKLGCGSSAVRNALIRLRRRLRECVEDRIADFSLDIADET